MGPPKRRKTYLDPGSSDSIPKTTKWRLHNSSCNASQPVSPLHTRAKDRIPQPAPSPESSLRPGHDQHGEERELSSPEFFSDDCDEEMDDGGASPEIFSFSDDCDEDLRESASFRMDDSATSSSTPPQDSYAFENVSSEGNDAFYADLAEPFNDDGTLTRGDAYMMLLDVAVKYGLSWTVIEAIQKLFNNLLGKKAFPESKYLFKKLCGVDITDIVFHFYCPHCKLSLGETKGSLEERRRFQAECQLCHSKYLGRDLVRSGSFFVSLPIEKQLEFVLSSKTAGTAVMDSLHNSSGSTSMSDITDGSQYRVTREKVGMAAHDLTVTVNCDGSPVFNSSKYSIWPVQITLNELPPLLRWKNVMMPLLWYGNEHPNMTLLLEAFVIQLQKLNRSGITWTFNGTQICSKVFCICCCADSPARAAMQHMMQFNGYFGCSWCYHPGNNIDGTVKYCLSEPHPDRTDEELVADMAAACHTGSTVKGVKGPSPLINLPGFSPVWSWCPDYMHCVLLGVSRQITELWLSECGMDYYCGSPSTLKVINERLCSIKMPECISRQPRALTVRKYWKASEWQYWLLYYSMPCLSNVLPRKYLEHWGLLVKGMFLLLKDSVSLLDVEHSAQFLTEFVVGVEFLYGQKNMTYNVHQVLHIPKSVVLFGPLWAHSCFSFEVNMGKLLRLVSSSNGVALQIATRLLLHSSMFALKALASDYALSLIEAKAKKILGKIVPLGNGEAVSYSFLRAHSALLGFEAVEYKRINVSGAIITSEKYIRHIRINSTAVILADGTYAKVKRIFCCRHGSTERYYIMSNVYSVSALMPTEHIKIAKQQYERLFEIDEHARPCIYFAFGSEELFCNLINSYEWS
ncbi:uncharacterized protein LOC142568670 [Dermacentor variabilis]|uniref:uncharacterized protein LOC142568670 n=1 Tax=Dermacentor variabilis TaxID=34621 RepID=UPI003F5AF547